MDFSLSEEQQLLKDSVDRFVREEYEFDKRRALIASDDGYSDDPMGDVDSAPGGREGGHGLVEDSRLARFVVEALRHRVQVLAQLVALARGLA